MRVSLRRQVGVAACRALCPEGTLSQKSKSAIGSARSSNRKRPTNLLASSTAAIKTWLGTPPRVRVDWQNPPNGAIVPDASSMPGNENSAQSAAFSSRQGCLLFVDSYGFRHIQFRTAYVAAHKAPPGRPGGPTPPAGTTGEALRAAADAGLGPGRLGKTTLFNNWWKPTTVITMMP